MEITAESPSTSPTVTRCICEELAGCVMQPRRQAPSRGLAPPRGAARSTVGHCRRLSGGSKWPPAATEVLRAFLFRSDRSARQMRNDPVFSDQGGGFFAFCRAIAQVLGAQTMTALSRALRASRPVSSLLSRQAPVLAVRSLRAAAPVQSSVPTVTTDNGTVGKRCHRRRCSIAGRYPGHLRCAGLSRGDRACLPESDRSLASRRRPQSPSTSSSTLIHLPITWRRCATPTPPTARSTTR